MFPCSKCGQCCRHVGSTPLGKDLDRGDGVCRHYDGATRLCRIYQERPLLCRVDEYYDRFLKDKMPREEWYRLNQEQCRKLQDKSAE